MKTNTFAKGFNIFVMACLLAALVVGTLPTTPAQAAPGVTVVSPAPLQGSFTSCAAVTEIPQMECEALVTFYNSTNNGKGWINKAGWLVTNTPCSTPWYGVECDTFYHSGNHVLSLDLESNALSGGLPALSGLTKLNDIDLSNNALSGSISDLGSLPQLMGLNLSENRLAGSISDFSDLGNLPQLQAMVLSDNQLTGSISDLGDLSQLGLLALNNNQLTGSIPELGSPSQLRDLRLSNNQLSGSIPTQWDNLTKLEYLDLHNNQLTGKIPSGLGKLTNLIVLSLNGNQLDGGIPPELGDLSQLRLLALNNNLLTGGIPTQIGNLKQLEDLYLDNNQLYGEFPATFIAANLPNFTNLTFDCGLTTTDPKVIAFINKFVPDWQSRCGRISGKVYQTDGVTPIENIPVGIQTILGYPHISCTDVSGHFSFDSVSLGVAWRVQAANPDWECTGRPEGYAPEYWQNAYTWDSATAILLSKDAPNFDSVVFTLDPGSLETGVVGASGGTVSTPNTNVSIDVPAGALSTDTALTVASGGGGFQITTDQSSIYAAASATTGPVGTTFAMPTTVTLKWPDTNNDGLVDGTKVNETSLYIGKNGVMLAGPCSSDPSCNVNDNTYSFQVSSLSSFAIGSLGKIFTSTGAYDGWVLETSQFGNIGGSINVKGKTFQLGDDALNRQYKAILSFNTLGLPINATITSAVIRIKPSGKPVGGNPLNLFGKLLVDVRKGTFGKISLAASDFQALPTLKKVGTFGKTATNGWYTVKLGAAGISKINRTGVTQFRLYFTKGDNGNLRADYMKFFSGNNSFNKPALIITYTLP